MIITIRKLLFGLSLIGLASCSSVDSMSTDAPSVESSVLPSAIEYPNGITHAEDGTIFVGSVVSGDIWRKRPNADFELAFPETPTRFAGTALRYDPSTNLLWVASPDFLGREINGKTVKRPHRIAVIDTISNSEIWSVEMPDGGFGNDFALDGKGGVFLTDSTLDKVWHIPSVGSPFATVVDGELLRPGTLGPAGIAFFPDGKLVFGLFSDGEILIAHLDENNIATSVETLKLDRKLHNPDGMFALSDHQLLILEGAVESGDGKLLQVDIDSQQPLKISVLADEIDSPLNLTVFQNKVFISEGRVRHLMIDDNDIEVPADFSVLVVELPEDLGQPRLLLPAGIHPESITSSHGKFLYSGSAVTGEIFRTNIETGGTEVFVSSRPNLIMSVQGLMAIENGDILYACTADLGRHVSRSNLPSRLVSFDLSSGEYLDHWDLPSGGLCNDISKFENNMLLISDTSNPNILLFDPNSGGSLSIWFEDEVLGGSQFNGNGIVWDEQARAVYLTSFQKGELLRINLSEMQSPVSVDTLSLPRALDGADALRLLNTSELILFENGLSTGSNGQISRVSVEGDQVELDLITDQIASPTSGVLLHGTIYVPTSYFRELFMEGQVTKRHSEIRRVLAN